jgi:hypothetical protein
MDVVKQENGNERSITQREAAEIIELWARRNSAARESMLSVDDVREVLSISEGEAIELLAQVRGKTPSLARTRRLTPVQTNALYAAIAVSVLNGGGYAIWVAKMFLEGSRLGDGDVKGAIIGALWSILCLWYFRRPIKRTLTGLGRQVSQGMP